MATKKTERTEGRAAPMVAQAPPPQGPNRPPVPPGGGPPAAPVERRIKYTAEIRVITEDFARAETGLKDALNEAKGYVASSESGSAPGSVRTGLWRMRVPVENFDSFRAAVVKLGAVEKNTSDSEDVTEEFYDLQAHIKNRQAEEEALRQLLEKSANNMENFLAIRREMNQVRDDINRKQGRLKLLANLTDLTTVTVALQEKQKYLGERAPETVEAPTFAMRAGKTFAESWHGLLRTAEFLLLFLILVAPWLPALLVLFGLGWWLVPRAPARPDTPLVVEPPAQEPPPGEH